MEKALWRGCPPLLIIVCGMLTLLVTGGHIAWNMSIILNDLHNGKVFGAAMALFVQGIMLGGSVVWYWSRFTRKG